MLQPRYTAGFIFASVSSNGAQAFLEAITSVYAIVIYVVILLGVTIALVVSRILKDNKTAERAESLSETETGGERSKRQEAAKEKKGPATRFYMLGKIDEERVNYRGKDYDNHITLKDFCESFRNFAADTLKLYYDISDIRKFVAGLGVSNVVILQGISGTGKTSLAYAFGEFLDNPATIIPIQPMWKERTDLIGYYNEFTKRFNETMFLQKLYEANYSRDIYITLLDEMNIARIEYYFAEFLSLLELPNTDKRYIDVVSDSWDTDPALFKNGQLKLPDNMWFIGTANNDDTTFSISDKVYDRAMILNLDSKSEVFDAPKTPPVHVSAERFGKMVKEALKEFPITRRNVKRLEILDAYMIENFHITFGNRIRKQILNYIPIYLSCGGEELEALDDILAKKLMRKLEMQNPVYLRNAADGLLACLDDLFGRENMIQCRAYINRLAKNA